MGAIGGATAGIMAGRAAGHAAGLGNTGNLTNSQLSTTSDSSYKGGLGYKIGAAMGKNSGNKARKANEGSNSSSPSASGGGL